MGRNDRRNRHNHKNWNNQNQNIQQNQNNQNAPAPNYYEQTKTFSNRQKFNVENSEEIQQTESAIKEFKSRSNICPKCGQPIFEMTSAISNAEGKPMHFDCVLDSLKEKEKLLPGQQMAYIGNGRFAVVTFENPRDLRKFKIEKTIEYEDKSKPIEWRDEMAELYSKVK